MQQMIAAMNKKTVLEVMVVADAVTDTELMDICMKFLLESENRYTDVLTKVSSGVCICVCCCQKGCYDAAMRLQSSLLCKS